MRTLLISLFVLSWSLTSIANADSGPFPLPRPLYCEFWYGNKLLTMPDAYMIFDPASLTVWTRSGSPKKTKVYQNLRLVTGVAPYFSGGYSLIIFGDVPVLSINSKATDTVPILAYMLDNHQATWGKVPGFPNTLNGGLCFEHPLFPQDFRGW